MAKRKRSRQSKQGQANKPQTATKQTAGAQSTDAPAATATKGGASQAATAGRGNAPNRREQMRLAAAKRRRRQNIMVYAGGAAIVALVALVVWINVRGQQPVAGEESLPTQGNSHIEVGTTSPVAYNSTPPTSGPHYPNLASWGVHNDPVRYEHLVHNLEDGGVVIYYQCPEGCPEMLASLQEVIEPYLDRGEHVALAPNDPNWTAGGATPVHEDMGAPIALVAWQKLLKLDEVEPETIGAFIERYEGIDHHRG